MILGKLFGRNKLQVEVTPKADGRSLAACSSCDVNEGQRHELFCEYEHCPFCGGQLASCDCSYENLGLRDESKFTVKTSFLPAEIYENGLPEELENKWCKILDEKGRVPFIQYPNVCAKCGALYPELFMVPDEEWQKYVEVEMRSSILCKACYAYIKYVTNQNI
jgi:hypothetical protein